MTQSLRLVDAKLRDNPEANRLFLEILTSKKNPEIALRRMNEAGVFGRFIPDFGRVVAQMQYDMYHVYTVDEHTLFAIGILHQIETGQLKEELPVASAIMPTIVSRRALYLATLLHDIAKGRGGDHSELGEKVALKLGPRLGLSAEETETVAWLVRWHLLMSSTAFKLDIGDPQTIQNFVERVQSPERLKLLLVLTAADIRAVGPKVWNGWKAALLRELYYSALDVTAGGLTVEARDARIAAAQAAARAPAAGFQRRGFRDLHRPRLSVLLAVARRRDACPARPADARGRCQRRAADGRKAHRPGARGDRDDPLHRRPPRPVLAHRRARWRSAGANIVDAKIMTMSNGMALDTLWVQDQDGTPFDRPDKLAKLAFTFEKVLTGDLKPHIELERPRRLPEPHPGLHRAAARPDRQQRERHPYGDRGQRPRPARAFCGR